MKEVIFQMIRDTESDLEKMHKTTMRMTERVAWEKAMVRLDDLKKILRMASITFIFLAMLLGSPCHGQTAASKFNVTALQAIKMADAAQMDYALYMIFDQIKEAAKAGYYFTRVARHQLTPFGKRRLEELGYKVWPFSEKIGNIDGGFEISWNQTMQKNKTK